MRTRATHSASLLLLAAVIALGSAGQLNAQSYIPYYGKNAVHYDSFEWHIYTTDHFEIYYYKENEEHLQRVASYAESAYQHVSSDLRHDLAAKVPLIIFKTHSEFEQQNVAPGAAQEGVLAFAEGERNRMVLPLDQPSDLLYALIVHELTHIFQYDIIPTSLIRRNIPLWVNEGGADYEAGIWNPLDLMMVRDAAVADIVPKMSEMEGYGNSSNPRLVYNLGHALYEFIEARWGKEGVRQFLFSLRKSAIGGGSSPYEEAFQMAAKEFDQQFEKYLKDRFKAFRDKERPADYGQDLSPDQERTHYSSAYSIEPSPSGDLIAVATGNRHDQELDIILVSSKDGSVVRNLTKGFDKDKGFEHISTPSEWNQVPWMTWSPVGDRIAYFARREKSRSLIVQNVINGDVERKVDMTTVDEASSPSISPDGRTVVFAGLHNAIGDIYSLDFESGKITNLTNDTFSDYAPVYAPDGKYLVYLARISGSLKLFRLDLDGSSKKTQLTFGTQDEAGAKFLDADTLIFPSTATDPATPLTPEIARNGNIFNLWSLNLKNGELKQYTDALGGVLSPVVLARTGPAPKLAFIDYYKGDYSLHTFDLREPLHTAASADFGQPGPIVDFQAPMQHTLVAENTRKKGRFEKMFLDGRPPVALGVTSSGDVFGGTQVSFTDVLGDQQFSLFASSVQQYKTMSVSYANLSRRFQYALQGYTMTQFFYGNLENAFYDPIYSNLISRSDALATQTVRGGTAFGIYPLNRYRRIEFSGGLQQMTEEFTDTGLQDYSLQYQQEQGQPLFRNGMVMPVGVAFIQETTVFREYGPLSGSTMRLSYNMSPPVGGLISNQTFDGDARYYARIAANGVLALRARGFKSWGEQPNYLYFGGNSEMRGYDYRGFLGHQGFYLNGELRFPLIEAMLTPLGVMGGIRGVFFGNLGGAALNSQCSLSSTVDTGCRGFQVFATDTQRVGTNTISGFRLVDAKASYGIGLETFALGFPIHFDWSYRTLFNNEWESLVYGTVGGAEFRKAKFAVWMGYDF